MLNFMLWHNHAKFLSEQSVFSPLIYINTSFFYYAPINVKPEGEVVRLTTGNLIIRSVPRVGILIVRDIPRVGILIECNPTQQGLKGN